MKKYSILFAIAYFILSYGSGELANRMHINAAVTMNVVIPMIAVFIAAWCFSRQQSRRPTPLEINAFSLQGLIGAWLASILLTIIVFTTETTGDDVMALLSQMSKSVLVVVGLIGTVVMSVLYYVIIRLAFLWFTKILRPA